MIKVVFSAHREYHYVLNFIDFVLWDAVLLRKEKTQQAILGETFNPNSHKKNKL